MDPLVKALQRAGFPIRALYPRNGSFQMAVSKRWVQSFFEPAERYYMRLEYDEASGELALVPFPLEANDPAGASADLVRPLTETVGTYLLTVPKLWVQTHLAPIEGRHYVRLSHRPKDNALILSPFKLSHYGEIKLLEAADSKGGDENGSRENEG